MSVLKLPAKIDLSQAEALCSVIRAQSGQDLTIDASDVTHFGALGLQVLLAAAAAWRDGGSALTLADPSAPFLEAVSTFGFSLNDLQTQEAA